MNINVRVASAQAQAQLKALQARVAQLETQLKSTSRTSSASSLIGGTASRKSMAAWGSQIQWTGRQLQYNWTIPLLLAGGAATKFALDNQKAFTHIKKVYGDSTDAAAQFNKEAGKTTDALYGQRKAAQVFGNELDNLQQSFVALSNRYGVAQKDVLETASAWAAAGQSGVALARSTELTLKTAILGDMDLGKATQSLISIQAQYSESTKGLWLTLSQLNAVENQTGISMQGLIDGFSRAAGVARESGIDVRHLAAMLAALVPATGSAATAGNSLKTIISRLMSPTKDAADVMKAFGVDTAASVWQSSTAMERLQIIAGHMDDSMHKSAQGGYELSDSQKQVVASILGSRYQMNKFLVLMRELNSNNGYYAKALNATSDRTKVFQQSTQELNAVLQSSPQRLKIIWTTLQNGMATAIQPLIPYIIYLAQQIADMVNAFASAPPAVQKLILAFLVLLALVGPLTKYFGSLMTLLFTLQVPLKLAAAGFMRLFFATETVVAGEVVLRASLVKTAATMMLLPFRYLITGFASATVAILSFARAIPMFVVGMARSAGAFIAVWRSMWVAVQAVWVLGWAKLRILSTLGALAEVSIFGRMRAALVVISTGLWRSLLILFTGGFRSLIVLTGTSFATVAATALKYGKYLVSWWGLALFAVLALFAAFHDQLATVWNNTVAYFANSNNAVVQMVIRAWNALPSSITNALIAVVRVVQQAALAVYHWLSYLNPFATHSPSLVDQVTSGTKIIADHYAGMASSIRTDILSAYAVLKRFGSATKSLVGRSNSIQEHQQRQKIAKWDPKALPAFDAMSNKIKTLTADLARYQAQEDHQQAIVDGWQRAVDRATAALDRQQKKLDALQKVQSKWQDKLQGAQDTLDKFASAPIKGMQKMSNAIFNNDMAQKKLQLQMMKMEDVTGPLDKIQSKLAAINGAQEMLRGDQAALRSAGAGSDILSYYDQQIKGLDGQKSAQADAAKTLQDLNNQLDALQRKGQELDLLNSLKFDPLTRQIEQAANAMKALPFKQIMAGVKGAQADIQKYTNKLDNANAAVARQQKIVDRMTAHRDKLQASLDRENKKLQQIKDNYDKISQAIQDMQQAMSDAASAADALQQAADAKKKKKKGAAAALSPAMQNFANAAGGNFPTGGGDGLPIRRNWKDQSAQIQKFTDRITRQAANAFADINPFDALKSKWKEFQIWLGKRWDDISAAGSDMFSHMFKGAGGSGSFTGVMDSFRKGWAATVKWFDKHIINPLKLAWKLYGSDIKDFVKNALHGFQSIWKQISPELKNIVGDFKDFAPVLKGAWRVLTAVLLILYGDIIPVFKLLLSVAAQTIFPLLQMIGGVLKGVLQMVHGALQIIEGFFLLFTSDWRRGLKLLALGVLNILGGLMTGIWALLKGAVKIIWGIIWGLVKGIFGFFKWLFKVLIGHSIIPDIIDGIFKWFKKLIDLPKWLWTHVLKPIFDKVHDLWHKYIQPAISVWFALWKREWAGLTAIGKWIWDHVLSPVWQRVKDLWAFVKGQLGNWWGDIKNIWNGLTTIGTWFKTNVMDKVRNAIVDGWHGIRDWLKANKDLLTGAMKGMVNGIIGAVDTIINGLNKLSDVLPGPINWHINPIDKLAGGGETRRANRGFRTNGPRAIVGEGKANYPEFVIPTDPTHRNRAKSLMVQAMAKMGMNSGASGRGAYGDTIKDMRNLSRSDPRAAMGAIPAFGLGGWLSDTVHGATHWFEGRAKDMVSKAVNPLLNKAESTVRNIGWTAIEPPPLYAISGMRNWLNDANSQYNDANKTAQDALSGGPDVRRAQAWAKSQVGKPYVWGGVGPGGYDCSGFMSAVTNVLRNRSPHTRIGTTATFPWPGWAGGRGPKTGFTIGSTNNYGGTGIGHMAGTLGGLNVESRGGLGVITGAGARGYTDAGFNTRGYWPLRGGGIALASRGPTLAALGDGRYDEAVVPLPRGLRNGLINGQGGDTIININGNLEFPNITSGDDAHTFIQNLESLSKD
jgi:TP901 family phage tail tape measure protein